MAKLLAETARVLADGRRVWLRSARPRDAHALAALIAEVTAERPHTLLIRPEESTPRLWRRRIVACERDDRSLLLLAGAGDELAGNLNVHGETHPNSPHVAWIGMSVPGAWRGLGVGAALLETAAEWSLSCGFTKLVLGVFPENRRAISFYEAHGFHREGLREDQYVRDGRYHDEVLMARFLTPRP